MRSGYRPLPPSTGDGDLVSAGDELEGESLGGGGGGVPSAVTIAIKPMRSSGVTSSPSMGVVIFSSSSTSGCSMRVTPYLTENEAMT